MNVPQFVLVVVILVGLASTIVAAEPLRSAAVAYSNAVLRPGSPGPVWKDRLAWFQESLAREQKRAAALEARADELAAELDRLKQQRAQEQAAIAAKTTKRLWLVDRKQYAEGTPREDGGWYVTLDGHITVVYPAPGAEAPRP
jgi:hypothetical protein